MRKRAAYLLEKTGWRLLGSALRDSLREGYGRRQLGKDLTAGLLVGVVAIPLAMALSIAVGLPPEHGLYTAAISLQMIFMSVVGGGLHVATVRLGAGSLARGKRAEVPGRLRAGAKVAAAVPAAGRVRRNVSGIMELYAGREQPGKRHAVDAGLRDVADSHCVEQPTARRDGIAGG